ncbi:cyanophycinase [Oscillospiraceae bacterium WX1]
MIGGAEDKKNGSIILRQAAELIVDTERLIVLTTATEKPEEAGRNYLEVFHGLGIKNVQIMNIATREEAADEASCTQLHKAKGLFMTGGDQLRLTSILGGTKFGAGIKNLYESGGVVMGTSAGASVMSSTMIVNGDDHEPAKKCTLKMAPGLGLLDGVIIDQHFDQRGRFGRLMCGIAENPAVLGIGIDEDTSIKLYPDMHFEVVGSNAVTILDGRSILSSNVSELQQNEILAIVGVTVDILPQGYGFDLTNRKVMRF